MNDDDIVTTYHTTATSLEGYWEIREYFQTWPLCRADVSGAVGSGKLTKETPEPPTPQHDATRSDAAG